MHRFLEDLLKDWEVPDWAFEVVRVIYDNGWDEEDQYD